MSTNSFLDCFSIEQQPILQYLLHNWKSLLVELPLYSNSFQLLLASHGVDISLELLEELLLELKKLIPNYILLRRYNAKVPGCSQMVVDYFNFEPLDSKIDLDTTQSEYKGLDAVLSDDSSYFKDQKKVLKDLLHEPTSLQLITKENILSEPAVPFIDACRLSTRECAKSNNGPCKKIHFQSIIRNNTDVSLGDCSYLNTCFKGKNCRYVHYQISIPDYTNAVNMKPISKPIVSLDEPVSRIGVSSCYCCKLIGFNIIRIFLRNGSTTILKNLTLICLVILLLFLQTVSVTLLDETDTQLTMSSPMGYPYKCKLE